MKPILIDSGPMIALFNRADRYFNASVQFMRSNKRPLVTSIANVTEAVYLLEYSKQAQADYLKWIGSSTIIIEKIESVDLLDIHTLFEKYHDVPMDFADACIVYLAERLGTNEIVTIDSDFDIYRLKGKKTFKNLLISK